MKLIQNNPYRIAGVLSSATARELQKQKAKIKAYTKVGKTITSDVDFQILGSVSRTEDAVNRAFSNIEQNQDKVNHALFWFLNTSPFDNMALEYLKNGDEEKAIEIWGKVTTGKEVNATNFSAFNNLGTYKLLSRDKSDIKTGIEAKIKLIASDYFENFVHSVADETFTIDNQKQSKKLVDELLREFKNQYSSADILQMFGGCNGTIQKYISQKFTEEPIHNIESNIESCKQKRKGNKSNAYNFGLNLANKCKEDFTLLKSVLGTDDLKYKAIADQLANEIMQCGIDYFNESQENESSESYLEKAQQLTRMAGRMAVGQLAKDRAKDSLATLDQMKDRELNHAIALLKSIKDAYEEAGGQISMQIAKQVSLGNLASINWSKVTEMKNRALDWDKVVEVISNGISMNDVAIIQRCENGTKVSEYKELVTFVLGKLNFSNEKKISYLRYWEHTKTKQVKPTRPAATVTSTIPKKTSTTSSDADNSNATESEFSFSENAFWILGVAGIIIGLMMGFGWGCIITGLIGLGIGSEFSN